MHSLAAIAALLLCVLTLPLTLELFLLTLAALRFRDKETLPALNAPPLRLAVVIAAHNEELLLARTLASVNAAHPQRIFVVAHNCADATARIAREAGAEVSEFNGPGGKGHALLHAFTHLREQCDAFLILDADTTIAPDLIARVTAALAAHDAVQCRYQASSSAAGARPLLAALAFCAINVVRPRGRSRLGLSCGILGNGFALRSSVLDRVPYSAHSIVEDLEYHLALVSAGLRVHYLDSARLYGEIAGSRAQHARWEGGRLQIARRHLPRLLPSILSGDLRLLEPALDLASLPIAQAAFLLLFSVLIPIPWLHFYAFFAIAVLALHVIVAAAQTPSPSATIFALFLAPAYIVRKLFGSAAILRSARRHVKWTRAERDTQPPRN
jgi:cellulose synthase/poly-beta-1,6-N-acetylglucosamine synthase-like glycosyltransferase